MKTLVIAFSGFKGVGKTTFAKNLKDAIDKVQYEGLQFNPVMVGLADAVKDEVAEVFGISLEELEELKRDETKKVFGDLTMRQYLIDYAEYKKQKGGKDIWAKKAWSRFLKKASDDKVNILIIPDLRFPEEQDFLKKKVGLLNFLNIFLALEGYDVNKDFGESFYRELDQDFLIKVKKREEFNNYILPIINSLIVSSLTLFGD